VEFAELNSYDIGGLLSAILRCVPLDNIRYIFGATGEGRRELREGPTHALHYSNSISIESDEDVRAWLWSNKPNEDPLDVRVHYHRPSPPARPCTPLEPRHRYLVPNAVSNWANALARRNVNLAAQPKGKAIPMNSTKACGSQNRQDWPHFLPGWSRSSSDISDNFDSHHRRVVIMASPVDQGGDSTGGRIPLSEQNTKKNSHIFGRPSPCGRRIVSNHCPPCCE